jgi:transposase
MNFGVRSLRTKRSSITFLHRGLGQGFIFLPPYSPELNIVEGLWKWLKSDVVNNVFYHTVAEIRKNVQSFMSQIIFSG